MKRILPILFCILTTACTRLSPLLPVPGTEKDLLARCRRPFPPRPFRAVHTIDARFPMGRRIDMIGVTVGDPATRRLRSVLVGVEGFTFFDATYVDGRTTIHRSVPPLDRKDFGWGLFRDVSMIFLFPKGKPIDVGRLADGRRACRFRMEDRNIIEVALGPGDSWRIRHMSPKGAVLRQITAKGPGRNGFLSTVTLRSRGFMAYSLHMKLLRSGWLDRAPLDLFRR